MPISDLLGRLTSTEATSEEGSVYRQDPRRRLDMRKPGADQFGLTPYPVDEARLAEFAKVFEKQTGAPLKRSATVESDWYVARSPDGDLATFIKCDKLQDGRDGLSLQGDQLAIDETVVVSGCTHHFVDTGNDLSVTLSYPRVFLKNWKGIEDAARGVLSEYKAS